MSSRHAPRARGSPSGPRGAPGRDAGAAGTGPARAAAAPLPPVPLAHPAFLIALLAAAGCVVATVTFRIADTDFWQHLAVGREIARTGHVPTTQVTSWPTHGQPDLTPSWLFRVLLWGCWQAGGMVGLFVWRWATTLAAFGLAWWTGRRMGARGFSALVVVAWAALFYRLRAEPRPESLVFVLIAAQMFVHEWLRRGGPRAAAFALPAIALVWANVHISYWIGLVLQAIYLADAWLTARRSRTAESSGAPSAGWLAAMIGASVAISFANPGGWKALAQPFEYWLVWRRERIYQSIGELEPIVWSQNIRNLLWLFVGGWPLLILLRLRKAGFDLAEGLVAALFLALAFASNRFLGFLAIAALPFVARDVGERLAGARAPAWATSPWVRAALAALLCVGGSLAEWRGSLLTPGVGVIPQWRPLAAADFMEREGVRGRGYNPFEYGGYLLWRFFPQRDRLPFMDIHQSGTREDRELHTRAMVDPAAWAALDRKYRFDWVMTTRFNVGGDSSNDHLDADSSFALVFLDDVAALYVRREGPMAELARTRAYRHVGAGFAVAPRVGAMSADSLQRPLVRSEIRRLEAESPFHATALSLEANALFHERRYPELRDTLRAALAIDPAFPFANSRLAEAALALGRPREALRAVRMAEDFDGGNDRLDQIRFRAQAMIREREPGSERPEDWVKPAKLDVGWPRGEK